MTTTWTSSLKPSLNVGRSGRSIRRAGDDRGLARTTFAAEERAGILPAAYTRSSTSIVSGKKSIPSRGFERTQVASTWVCP